MKKVLFGISAMVMLLTACQDKDDTTPGNEQWYLSKIISIDESGNDTTEISYNADNTVKEFYTRYASEFDVSAPVYEGGKIISIREKASERPEFGTRTSFVYTGDNITRINNYAYDNATDEWSLNSQDSLVYAGGKLVESYNTDKYGYSNFYKLTWEGGNVKSYERSYKDGGNAAYILFEVVTNTYDTKPSYQRLIKDNYTWLANTNSFENLSANNLVKQEKVSSPETLPGQRTTITLTYDDNGLLKATDTHWENLLTTPVDEENYRVVFEYSKR